MSMHTADLQIAGAWMSQSLFNLGPPEIYAWAHYRQYICSEKSNHLYIRVYFYDFFIFVTRITLSSNTA